MFSAICALLFAIGCVVLICAAGGLELWIYLVLGGTALLCLLYGLWKLNDETDCFTALFDRLSRRLDEKEAKRAREERAQRAKNTGNKRTAKPKTPFFRTGMQNMGSHIGAGILMGVLVILYIFVYRWVIGLIRGDAPVGSFWGHFSIVGILVSAVAFGFVSVVNAMPSFSAPIFNGYHPVGRTVTETEQYIVRIFEVRGYAADLRRASRVCGYAYMLIIGIFCIFDPTCLSLLVASPAFLLGQLLAYGEDTCSNYIEEKSKCKVWRRYVCGRCRTLIGSGSYVGRRNERSHDDYYRETTTTTTTTTTTYGDTTYVDTDVDTQVQDYKITNYAYDNRYICPHCGEPHDVYESGYYRTNL